MAYVKRVRKPITYESIVAKYVARGIHPLSAKAQADQWQERQRSPRARSRAKEGLTSCL